MRKLFLLFVFLMCFPLFAQDDPKLYTTNDGKFQFVIPENWEFMKEEHGRVTLIHVGDTNQYVAISIRMTNTAPTFEEDSEAVEFILGSTENAGEFESEMIGKKTVLIRENDAPEVDTLFAIILMDDGVAGALEANELDFPADLEFLRHAAEEIIMSLTYIEPETIVLDELETIAPDTSDLTATYEWEAHGLTLQYPKDWITQTVDANVMLVATSKLSTTSIPDYGIQIFTSQNPPSADPSGAYLHELLIILMNSMEFSDDADILDVNLDGRRASIVQDESTEIAAVALMVDEDTFAALIGIPSDDTSIKGKSIVYAIASTLQTITPDVEPVKVDASHLTETYTVESGFYSFDYPDNWIVSESDGWVEVASSEDNDEQIADGHVRMIVTVFSKTKEENIDADATLVEVAEAIQSPGRLESTPATEIMLNDKLAVTMDMGITEMDGMVVYIELTDDLVAQVLAFANEGDFDAYTDTVWAMASSIQLR